MAVDLHAHSNESDGSDTPEELIQKAARIGLSAIALTDHDTLGGINRAQAEADRQGIELISGTELSVTWSRGGMHMIVLWLPPGSGPLQDKLRFLQDARASRNDRMVDRLQELGYDITSEEVAEEAGTGVIGRPHFAAILVRKGYVPTPQAAFDELLAKGAKAYLGRDLLEPVEAIGLALASGAVPIIAHPHTLGLDTSAEFADAFDMLADAGLVGMEAYYSEYNHDRQQELAGFARSFGLVPSGGSDYHGTYKADLELGSGRGELVVPDEVLAELRTHAKG